MMQVIMAPSYDCFLNYNCTTGNNSVQTSCMKTCINNLVFILSFIWLYKGIIFLNRTTDAVIMLLLLIFILVHCLLLHLDGVMQYFFQPADAIDGRSTAEYTSMAIWMSTGGLFLRVRLQ